MRQTQFGQGIECRQKLPKKSRGLCFSRSLTLSPLLIGCSFIQSADLLEFQWEKNKHSEAISPARDKRPDLLSSSQMGLRVPPGENDRMCICVLTTCRRVSCLHQTFAEDALVIEEEAQSHNTNR